MDQKSISWIDSMKGIAMCGVIMIHLGGAALPSILGRIGNIGRNGVQVFFLVSAYLTFSSLYKFFGGVERMFCKGITVTNASYMVEKEIY